MTTATLPGRTVIGLDLSITASGVCLPDGTTHTIKTRDKDGDKRLMAIADRVSDVLTGGALVVMEEAPPGLKGAAIKAIHMVHGAVRLRLISAGIDYALINPTTLKGYATGKPGADKIAMAMAAYKRAEIEFADDNQCDAWWLRAAGLDWLGHPIVQLPAAQRAHLNKATWPIARTAAIAA